MHVKANGREFYKPAEEKPFITLSLSREAAHALMYVVGSVIGSTNGKRGYIDAIYYALKDSGLDIENFDLVAQGQINFKD